MAFVYSSIVSNLSGVVPFVGPDALQRQSGRPFELRLGANESAFGISPLAERAITRELQHVAWYGDPESYELRRILNGIHAVGRENIVVGSGIDDLLGLVVRAFVDPGDAVVTSLGGYPTFDYHVRGYGGRVFHIPYREFRNDVDKLVAVARRLNAKLVYLANPDNPTGTYLRPGEIQAAVSELPDSAVLLLDEAYVEFAPKGATPVLDVEQSRVIRFRTFSKVYGLAGLRIGYALAAKEVIDNLNKIRLHYGVNRVAQAAALASLQDADFVKNVIREIAQGREDYYQIARTLGLEALPSATNFVAFVMENNAEVTSLVQRLAYEGVFVRVPGGGAIRSVRPCHCGRRTGTKAV